MLYKRVNSVRIVTGWRTRVVEKKLAFYSRRAQKNEWSPFRSYNSSPVVPGSD